MEKTVTRIFFSAGESSGDIHGANLIRALVAEDAALECEGLGGRHMAAAGMELRYDLAGRAIMGFTEIVKSFAFIRKLFHETVDHLSRTKPDALVVIDYPGFNLRLAKRAKAMGIPVVYYISPQVWAWKKGRIHTIAQCVEKMLVILPFEEKLYADAAVDCAYVGHPLLDHLATVTIEGKFSEGLVIGLLPGSREQEIRRILGVMIDVARGIRDAYPEARFVTPCVDEAREAQVRVMAGDFPLETLVGQTYELLDGARFCLVASGTATLETALFGVPMAVLYKVSTPTYWLARLLVDVDAIAMVNILAGRKIVPEFVQNGARRDTILKTALELIDDTPERETMLDDLSHIRDTLGGSGASKSAAHAVLDVIKRKGHG